MSDTRTPVRAIRQHCVECSGGSSKAVAYCSCDGVHSTWCPLWPYRFGRRPETAAKRYGERFLNPKLMPGAGVNLEDLPPVSPDRAPETDGQDTPNENA